MSADLFADWYPHQLTTSVGATYGPDGQPTPEQALGTARGQLRQSTQLVRDAGGQETTSTATFACSLEDAALFPSGATARLSLAGVSGGTAWQVITVAINDADPVLAGATVYLS